MRRYLRLMIAGSLWLSAAHSANAQPAYFSLTGGFPTAGDQQNFYFDFTRPVGSGEVLRFETFANGGGTNAAGDLISPGGIDSVLELFDSGGNSRGRDDDGSFTTGADSLLSWPGIGQINSPPQHTPLNPDPLLAGGYLLRLSEFGNNDPGQWALDLVGPADAIALTDLSPIGTSTISRLAAGNGAQVSFSGNYELDGEKVLTFKSGADFTVGGFLDIGNTSNGTLTVEGPGTMLTTNTVSTTYLDWGRDGGAANILISNGATATINAMRIDMAADTNPNSVGQLIVDLGAHMTANSINVGTGCCGTFASAIGVEDLGSSITQNGAATLSIGGPTAGSFSGVLAIRKSGVFNAGSGGINVNRGGDIVVQEGGALNTSGSIVVASHGHPVSGGGTAGVQLTTEGQITSGNVIVGTSTADGSVLINGFTPGFGLPSTWQVTGSMTIGSAGFGSGSATVEQGGLLNVSNNLTVVGSMDATGTLTVQTSGDVNVGNQLTTGNYGTVNLVGNQITTGSFVVQSGGTFHHEDGTLTVNGGTFDPGGANYRIDGADAADLPMVQLINGALANLSGNAYVGYNNRGQLTVLGSSIVSMSAGNMYLAYFGGSEGHVAVGGVNSGLTVSGDLEVGDGGTGTLRIEAGAKVYSVAVGPAGRDVIGDDPDFGSGPGNGSVVVTGQNSLWETDDLVVGEQGLGTLTIEDHAWVNSGNASIGRYSGSNGSFVTVGASSEWNVTGNLYVGGDDGTIGAGGTAVLSIGSTAHVGTRGSGIVSTSIWGPGQVNVSGFNAVFYAGATTVGTGGPGAGAMNVSDGAFVLTDSLQVGTNAGNGAVTITGANSNLGVTGLTASMTIGSAGFGSGSATVEQAGLLNVSNNLTVTGSMDATGMLTVKTSGEVTVGNQLTIGNYGTVNLLGSQITAGSFIVQPFGTFTHEDGTLTVYGGTFDPGTGTADYVITGATSTDRPKVVLTSGASSTLAGVLVVGLDNWGELVIEDGSTLSAANVRTGHAPNAPANGKITVRGAGSRLIVTAAASGLFSFEAGYTGPGELTVSAGGQVIVQQGTFTLGCCSSNGAGYGEIVVEGEDSRLEAKDFWFRASGGNSRVTIRDHALAHATDPNGYNEIWPGSAGDVTDIDVEVADTGSLLKIDGSLLRIYGYSFGSGGTARLTIRNGGAAQVAGDVQLYGLSSPGSAYIDVDGGAAGTATLAVGGTLYVGGTDSHDVGGTAKVTVANDGLVTAGSVKVWPPGTVELDSAIISTSTLELAGGGTLRGNGVVLVSGALANGGVVSPGVSPGVITVSGGNYEQATSGRLAIEIGGQFSSQYDRLDIVSGTATLAGTLDVSLIDLGSGVFAPSAGQTFDILTAAGGLGGTTFATELLPALAGGLFFDVVYNPTAVTLAVSGILGDYNHNGVVDAADYVVWRKTLGQSGPALAADGTGPAGQPDGVVDQLDYDFWRAHFGQTAGSGTVSNTVVPEPAGALLSTFAAIALCRRGQRIRPNTPSTRLHLG